ncbi:MAG TPA: radical SAM family heme chaperone HemW [Chthoniobacterales bacterium]|nr:radical SAM family heme chaperone HemW [Chthoniobacterales bacterium]
MAQKKTKATFRNIAMSDEVERSLTISAGELQPETSEHSSTLPETTRGPVRHLYVHIPFCARICPYCAFYKELLDRSETPRFCEAILRELQGHKGNRPASAGPTVSNRLKPVTIYFGGGTPTALTTAQLQFLLESFRSELDLTELVEWTTEANPGSVSATKASLLRRLGINRVSLGVQSWDDDLLKLLGREHNAKQARESFEIFRDAGFQNINVDLMFGLPGQTIDQWRDTLEQTIGLEPQHISTYCLTYEEDTEFFVRHARGEFRQDSDADAEFFETTMSLLEAGGYEHYEISNYARPGFRSLHNQGYWSGADYLGIGPSAFSTIGLTRSQNVCDFRQYSDAFLSGRSAIGSAEQLSAEMKRAERIALSLRTDTGAAAELFNSSPDKTREFLSLGLLRQENDRLVLTRAGKALADSIAAEFV